MKKKIGKVLPIIIGGIGLLSTVLSYYKDEIDRDELKEEVRNEVMEEVMKKINS